MNIGLGNNSKLISFANIADGKQTIPQNNQETSLASPIKLIILKQNFRGLVRKIGLKTIPMGLFSKNFVNQILG